tara:strand:+ start:43 stop:489 length:447 start_codon:yes stop_codon:yes gene_type:complete
MQTTIKINNLQETLKQLGRLEESMEKPLQEVLMGGGQLIRSEAIKSIQTGAKSGIVYEKYNPRRSHRSSAPGQAPASDTGNLVSKIIVKNSKDQVQVQSNADYSKFLEYGTSKMDARPFMFPASVKSTPKIIQATFNKVVQVIKGLAK